MPSKNKPYKSVRVVMKVKSSGELMKPKCAIESITAEQLKKCKECIKMNKYDFHPTLSKIEKLEYWLSMGGSMFNSPAANTFEKFKRFARENVAFKLSKRKKDKMTNKKTSKLLKSSSDIEGALEPKLV